jgi:hypothetical protein
VRLTLRTLLAYLDDTLEPAQAKLIGQKVAESETAQQLIARIKEVTRQRRLTAPPPTGGKLDANVAAGYLDNTLPADQLAEVEQTCLESDLLLAELGACHQILTLVLGEPALVPPTAKQRMYGLVKGPEAIPFRKPTAAPREREELYHEHRETDETLRMGLPALRGRTSWTNRLLLIGGGLGVAALLVIAILQILQFERTPERRSSPPQAARDDGKPPSIPASTPAPVTSVVRPSAVVPKPPSVPAAPQGEKPEMPPDKKPGKTGKSPPSPVENVAWAAPSPRQVEVGQYERNPTEDPGLLLQKDKDNKQWQRLDLAKNAKVFSGRPLVSLPGYRSVVSLSPGLRLTLWGNVPELWLSPPVLESLVELHQTDQFDADLTLRRGRIVLTSTQADRPARVRVRFDNPTVPTLKETWDLTLLDPGTEVAMERWGQLPVDEGFFKDPADKMRKGPRADVALVVLKGRLQVNQDDRKIPLKGGPTEFGFLLWDSYSGNLKPGKLPEAPGWYTTPLPYPKGMEQVLLRPRAEFYDARAKLALKLAGKVDKVDSVLADTLNSPASSMRVLVVRAFGAMDNLERILNILDDPEPGHDDIRQTAVATMRQWISYDRSNDYALYDLLKTQYKPAEAENIMLLLHGFSPKDLSRREPYETMIEYLNHPNPTIRQVSAMDLYLLVPAGRQIAYSSVADSRDRERAQREWTKLLDSGQIPPRPPKK